MRDNPETYQDAVTVALSPILNIFYFIIEEKNQPLYIGSISWEKGIIIEYIYCFIYIYIYRRKWLWIGLLLECVYKTFNQFVLFSLHVIYSPTKVKHHLTCFNNIFSNNELISNRFAVFATCTHILTYLWNRLLIDFYLCVKCHVYFSTFVFANESWFFFV